jgi:hypothetical protein
VHTSTDAVASLSFSRQDDFSCSHSLYPPTGTALPHRSFSQPPGEEIPLLRPNADFKNDEKTDGVDFLKTILTAHPLFQGLGAHRKC